MKRLTVHGFMYRVGGKSTICDRQEDCWNDDWNVYSYSNM